MEHQGMISLIPALSVLALVTFLSLSGITFATGSFWRGVCGLLSHCHPLGPCHGYQCTPLPSAR